MMNDSFLAVALLALATVLIIAEIFIPSGGILALTMFASLFAGFYYAWVAWWETSPGMFFGYIAFAIAFIPGVTIFSLNILSKTKYGKRILLEGPREEEVVPFAQEQERLDSYVGQIAKTITPLNPGGMVMIDHERIHAHCEGMIIENGTDVEIIKATGTRVLVREVRLESNKETSEKESKKTDEKNPFELDSPE